MIQPPPRHPGSEPRRRAARGISTLVAMSLLAAVPAIAADTLVIDADRAVEMTLAASPLGDAAAARVDAAGARVDAADGDRLPIVDATAVATRRSSVPELSAAIGGPGTEPVTIFPDIRTTYSTDLVLSQPLYTGGAIGAGRRAARSDLEAAGAERQTTLADLRLAARRSYWSAVRAAASLDAAEAAEVRAERLVTDARNLREFGMAVDADVLAAEARLAASRVRVIRAEAARAVAVADLRSLAGLGSDTPIELADLEATSSPSPPPPLAELEQAALEDRPELAALASRASTLDSRAEATLAARRPSLSLAAGYEIARPNPRHLPLSDQWNDSWSVALRAGWTLFDGARTEGSAAALRADGEALRAQRRELVRQIGVAVEQARRELDSSLEAVAAADAAQRAASRREEAARERHKAGMAPISDVLDAQAELASAEMDQARSRTDAWLAAARLERAVGR